MTIANTPTTVTVPAAAARYEDSDDPLALAVAEYVAERPALKGWDLSPRWADDQRDEIVLTVPVFAAR